MRCSEIITLFDYNYWANARVLEAAAKVGEAQFTAPAGAEPRQPKRLPGAHLER